MKEIFKNKKSFTLVELLVVIGILAILTSVGFIELSQFKSRRSFDLDLQAIVEAIRTAQNKAIQQEEGLAWGVRFFNSTSSEDTYQIFKGSTYLSSSVIDSQTLSSATLYTNPPDGFYIDIVFQPRTGLPLSGSGTLIVIKRKGGSEVYSIAVGKSGRISTNLEKGLVGYWPMDEESGGTIYDASGNNNSGTVSIGSSGAQTSVSQARENGLSGRVGYSLSFDGTDDYVSLPSVNPTSAITVSAWIKSNSASGYSGLYQMVSKYSAYILGTSASGGNTVCFIVYTTTWQYNPCVTVSSPDSWHHFVGTYDSLSGERKIYLDGVYIQTATSTGSIANDSGPIHLAHREAAAVGSDHMSGLIDDVRIYNRALSSSEVQNLYNSY